MGNSPSRCSFARRAASVQGLAAHALFELALRRRSRMAAFERLGRAMPAGLFSGHAMERQLARLFARPGRTNDFRKLKRKLVLVATDLDSGESAPFGQTGWDAVPISQAVQASSALPGLFPSVEIGGRYYVDGALKKTLHASVLLDEGVDLLLCLNPVSPHMTEEMWEICGFGEPIYTQSWPTYDENKLVADEVEIAVQIKGKVRGRIMVPASLGKDAGEKLLENETVKKLVGDAQARKDGDALGTGGQWVRLHGGTEEKRRDASDDFDGQRGLVREGEQAGERAVEGDVALAGEGHTPSGLAVGEQSGEGLAVGGLGDGAILGHGDEDAAKAVGGEPVAVEHAARVAGLGAVGGARSGIVDAVCLAEQFQALDRDEARIAWPEGNTVKRAGLHSWWWLPQQPWCAWWCGWAQAWPA